MATITAYDNPALNSAIQKSWKRLVPLMFILYFVAFIDRVNVGFAKDAMQLDIGLSDSAFALGAGIFFAAYALFGIPANLILNKIGAQKWLSITTVIWGVLSAMTGFVTNETQFIVLRFLLGLGEAGFYPGILLLASIYFPNKVRGSVIGIFVLGVPLALTLGSPLSGALLELHGWMGRPGWFWMFVIEGLPAVVIGVFAFFWLDDSPEKARFLTAEEKKALTEQLASENAKTETTSVLSALKNIKVWHLALIYGTIQISVYGLMFFLPSQVASLMGQSLGFKASLVAAIPWACSAFGVYYIPRLADKNPSRRVAISVMCMLAAAVGLALSAFASPVFAIAALCLSAVGFLSVQPVFWTFPPQLLSGPALAAGIGFCTTMGAFCSFLAPIIRVEMDKLMNSNTAGIITLAVITVGCALLIALLKKNTQK
ncbi:MFS transporter [Morganella morganii]|uniref:Nitrate/nitrite transporter n=5 Tax=Bacteria TaxID=2 RepID=M1RK32_MORMO|nr:MULTISPECIES: MFS transporter [Morganella]AGG30685.1 Nitrate/nitrite transporter [Morganella morganii subsp. morganii KT]AMG69453.1 MFS transporter [Morganella morganii]AVK37493.1 inner membrane transport protein RhmT [Morganella morganii]AZP26195.1 MFS transporter [Morganella morganii]EJG2204029.1 MFS transporter [Morganella morganii]